MSAYEMLSVVFSSSGALTINNIRLYSTVKTTALVNGRASVKVKAEITWNVMQGEVIYIVDSVTFVRKLPIQTVIDPIISEQINAHYTFSFDTVIDQYTKHILNDDIIEIDNDYFIVGRILKRRDTTVSMSIGCEHISYKLLAKNHYPMPFEDIESSPYEIMSALLALTPFRVGTVELDGNYYIKPNSDNIRGALIELANLVGGELVWDKFTVSLVRQRGQNKGLEFRLGKNLVSVTEEIDTTSDEPRHALEVDVLDLARIPEYSYLASVELGDTVRTYDPELDIDDTLRIVSRDYNPFQRINPSVSIGNYIRDITDYDKHDNDKDDSENAPREYYNMEIGQGELLDTIITFLFEQEYDEVETVSYGLLGNTDEQITFSSELRQNSKGKYTGVEVKTVGNIPEGAILTVQAVCYVRP